MTQPLFKTEEWQVQDTVVMFHNLDWSPVLLTSKQGNKITTLLPSKSSFTCISQLLLTINACRGCFKILNETISTILTILHHNDGSPTS